MSQQQKFTDNDSSDSSNTSDSSLVLAAPMIRANAGTPTTWSPLRIPSVQDMSYSPTRNVDEVIDDYHISESESQSAQFQESDQESEQKSEQESEQESEQNNKQDNVQPMFPNFMTGLLIMVSLISAMELPSRPITAALVGVVGLVYNYRNIIGTRNMQILAGVGIYAACAAIWLMFEWQYQLQIKSILTNKTNMFNKFVTTHIQHIVLWPLTIIINFMRRSAYPFLSAIGTNISNFYTL